ncbi:uncharacterized protein LOC133839840 [Drosophila sulfurigaster albostrigata]|uniref:uncharacterized protein LOC133839840 n=1 Tax=Drosophila sulfurigaster albostrigata TaxID=89887 RepID=UPI002D21ACD6|nr:uncharacterized protein LOC133839840 [Drosophila sulfurigaster albostrigata]
MRCHWLCLLFFVLLLDQLARQSEAQRTRRRSNSNEVTSRTSTSTRRSAVQSRIVSGTSSSSSSNRRNRRSRSGRRKRSLNSRSSRNKSRSGRTSRNRNRRSSSSSSSTSSPSSVSSRIVDNSVQARIVDGSSTSISKMPYLVQVHRGSDALCGGSLIETNWVLTAGHCVHGYSASDFYVVAGTSTLNGTDGVSSSVSYAAVAPKFTTKKMNMDAALLKLDTALSGTNVATISMATHRPKAGASLLIGGWGATKEGGSAVKHLRSTRVTVVKQSKCKKDYKGSSAITKYMFCAGGNHKDTCSGDSGGSVVKNKKLFGITSFGLGCARANYPGVYTNVAAIRSWVNTTIADNS